MDKKFRIFGNSLDPVNSPERLELKRAYISYLQNATALPQQLEDPYDFIKTNLTSRISGEHIWAGKVPVDSWLTPRPGINDSPTLNADQCSEFLESNGCWDYALRTAEFVEKHIFPNMPVMIGVDHSSTGGLLMALSQKHSDINVIVIDAHFDMMKYSKSGFKGAEEQPLYYHCGNFLSYILEREIIRPENLWILGVGEKIFAEEDYNRLDSTSRKNADEVKRWINNGVNVRLKDDIGKEKMNINLNGPTYISIDMDVGSLSSIFSARYMTSFGLSFEEFQSLLSEVAQSIRTTNVPFIGLDIMEIDIHLLEITGDTRFQDFTQRIVEETFNLFLE